MLLSGQSRITCQLFLNGPSLKNGGPGIIQYGIRTPLERHRRYTSTLDMRIVQHVDFENQRDAVYLVFLALDTGAGASTTCWKASFTLTGEVMRISDKTMW